MPTRYARCAFALVFFAVAAAADDTPQWSAGQHVETYDPSSTQWKPARITSVEDWRSYGKGYAYRVHIEDPAVANPDFATTGDRIRLPGGLQAGAPAAGTAAAAAGATYAVGATVDVYYESGQGKNRGRVLEVQPGRYKVHYTGCTANWDEWVDRGRVRPPATLAATSPEVAFLVGRWAMFTPSYPNTVIRGDDVYREYGPGGKSPPLELFADGRYVWYYDYGKPPVQGRWTPDAKVPGADMGTASVDGVLIADPSGQEWKVYRRVLVGDTKDAITAQQMCSGLTQTGTRLR